MMKLKALAYVVHEAPAGERLLVFARLDRPEAGLQVPAGTVEPGETPEQACRRELLEEAGVVAPGPARLIGVFEHRPAPDGGRHRRHVFRLQAPVGLPEQWLHVVSGDGRDRGRVLRCHWVDLQRAERLLAAGQGAYLRSGRGRAGRARAGGG